MSATISAVLALLLAQSGAAQDIAWVWHSSGAPAGFNAAAVLLDQLTLTGETVDVRRRMTALALPPGSLVIPVVHVQNSRSGGGALNESQRQAIIESLQRATAGANTGWIQLDFEPLPGQRSTYLSLVKQARAALPIGVRLSVTVLAASCTDSIFIQSIAADEIVPMFFGAGARSATPWTHFLDDDQLDARCQTGAAGFARGQKLDSALRDRYPRRYWFNYTNWN